MIRINQLSSSFNQNMNFIFNLPVISAHAVLHGSGQGS